MKKKIDPATRNTAATKAWLGVVRAYNLCDVQMGQALATLGVRVAEHEVLVNIHLEPGLTQQTLSTRCFVAKSGVSATVSRMEEQRWLRRASDAGDGRVKRLFLTEMGAKLAEKCVAVQAAIVGKMMTPLSDAELNQLIEVAKRIAAQLE